MAITFRLFCCAFFLSVPSLVYGGAGTFVGSLELRFDSDQQSGTLLKDFGYKDPSGREWPVPRGAAVDGASIPRALWSIIGSPWVGKYRRASVIHDYYCESKTRGWRNVHRVFYDAMITDGVSNTQAKIMYGAVVYFGPKWKTEYGVAGVPRIVVWQPDFEQKKFEQLQQWIEKVNPSPEEIDALVQ